MRHALDVANYFIDKSGYTKTNLQVMKMTYVAHGYMLAIHDEPLIGDLVEAWKNGPVIPKIYKTFKKWNLSPIGKMTYTPESFTDKQDEMLDAIFKSYGRFCGYYLSQITHEDDRVITPWKQCYVPGKNVVIPDDITKKYYKEIAGIQK